MTPDTAGAETGWAARHMPLTRQAVSNIAPQMVTLNTPPDAPTRAFAHMLQQAGCDVGCLVAGYDLPIWDTAQGVVLGGQVVSHVDHKTSIDLRTSALRTLAEDSIGIGQASVMALVDITNLQLAGRQIHVIGATTTAMSIARHAKAFGGRVTILEADPILALTALYEGHSVSQNPADIVNAEVILIPSTQAAKLVSDHLPRLRDAVLICNVSAEVSLTDLALPDSYHEVRDHVRAYPIPGGATVKLIAGGAPVQHAAASGLPLEASDLKCALWATAIVQMTQDAERTTLSPAREAHLAQSILDNRSG